jgi:hypothetical protein
MNGDDQFPILFYFMVLDGDTPSAWSPFKARTMEMIAEEIYGIRSFHPMMQKQIKLRLLCENFDTIKKGLYARMIGCVIDGEALDSANFKAFKSQYKKFLGKTMQADSSIRDAQGFRLVIVSEKNPDDPTLGNETIDELTETTKFNLQLSGRGVTHDYASEERRFRQIANAVLAEIRANETLPRLLSEGEA